jgi:CRISPR-associated protein Cas2
VSGESARRYLVAYDIADDRRRIQVAHVLGSYGDRIQFSVFVIDARPAALVRLRSRLARMIDPCCDSVLVCDLGLLSAGADSRFEILGARRPITDPGPLIL